MTSSISLTENVFSVLSWFRKADRIIKDIGGMILSIILLPVYLTAFLILLIFLVVLSRYLSRYFARLRRNLPTTSIEDIREDIFRIRSLFLAANEITKEQEEFYFVGPPLRMIRIHVTRYHNALQHHLNPNQRWKPDEAQVTRLKNTFSDVEDWDDPELDIYAQHYG